MKPDRKHVKPQPQPRKPARPQITLGKKNYILMGAGIAVIIAGFITLSKGSITIAPILLVLGYCVIIPVAILVK